MKAADPGQTQDRPHVPGETTPSPPRIRPIDVVLSIVGLSAVAVGQPLLDLIGRNPPFFVAHNMQGREVVLLAVAVIVVAPLVAATMAIGVGRMHRWSGVVLATVFIAGLGAVLALVVLRLSGLSAAIPTFGVVLTAAAAGLGVGLGWLRLPQVRRALNLLAVAAPVVLVLFLVASPARTVVRPPPPPPAAAGIKEQPPPVVLVIFDELPLVSLLSADRTIDATTFPAFGRLAADGTWYRNATTGHGFTPNAVPSILTGRYTEDEALPLAADHPVNLFSQLRGVYEFNVVESVTDLCTDPSCEITQPPDYGQILRDLAVVEGHLVAPPEVARRLPTLDEGFDDFRAAVREKGKHDAFIDLFKQVRADDLPAEFDGFVRRVRAGDKPGLHVLHTLLPHRPWRYLPDGRPYTGERPIDGVVGKAWRTEPWAAAHGYQRHLLQVQLVDRLLGGLLDRLDEQGLYDDALIVVVADHGVSLKPDRALRRLSPDTIGEIAPVPLIIKHPQQSAGVLTDAPVETVDILPTVLDRLGAPVPAGLDGQSLTNPASVRRRTKNFFTVSERVQFPANGQEKWPALRRKLRVFGAVDGRVDPYRVAPAGLRRLLGRTVPATAARSPRLAYRLDDPEVYEDLDVAAKALPALLTGTITGAARQPRLMIGLNGRLVAATVADLEAEGGRWRFRALLPPTSLRAGNNTIELFVAQRGGALQRLDAAG